MLDLATAWMPYLIGLVLLSLFPPGRILVKLIIGCSIGLILLLWISEPDLRE